MGHTWLFEMDLKWCFYTRATSASGKSFLGVSGSLGECYGGKSLLVGGARAVLILLHLDNR